MSKELARALINAGVHYGHGVSRWNPKMKPYIFGKRGTIHIINVKETIKGLLIAKKLLSNVVASGKDVVFVGTKRQAKDVIIAEATRCGMPYVNERWWGGMLTNFLTIQKSVDQLKWLEKKLAGNNSDLKKKEIMNLEKEKARLEKGLLGIKNMDVLPGAIFVIDPVKEAIAVSEANKLAIPVVALVDTDCDPDKVDYVIPGNDDAVRAIKLITGVIANAVLEGAGMLVKTEDIPVHKAGLSEVPRSEEVIEDVNK